MEHGGSDDGVEQADGGVVDVPEAAGADLHDQEDGDGNQDGEQGSGPDGNDLIAHRVGEFGVHDLAVLEVDGERARGCRLGFVDSETDGAQADHGEDVGPEEVSLLLCGNDSGGGAHHVPFSHWPNRGLLFSEPSVGQACFLVE